MTIHDTFPEVLRGAERDLDAAGDEPDTLHNALTRGCALIEGYWRAGGIDNATYRSACHRLRTIAEQHRMARTLREQLSRSVGAEA